MRDAHKRADRPFPLDHQPQGRTLDPSGRKARPHGSGKRRGNQISAKAIQNAAAFLRGHQRHINGAGILDSGLNRAFRDFSIGDALCFFQFQSMGHMPRDSFSFSIRVCGQINSVGLFCQRSKAFQHVRPAFRGLIVRFEIRCGYTHFLDRQIADVADRCSYFPISAQEGLYFFHLAGGFNDKKFRTHDDYLFRPSGGAKLGSMSLSPGDYFPISRRFHLSLLTLAPLPPTLKLIEINLLAA